MSREKIAQAIDGAFTMYLHRWPMVLWLTVLWVLLWGDLSVANVLAGFAIALGLMVLTPMPRVGFVGRVNLFALAYLMLRFVVDVVRASVQVSAQALHFGHTPRGGVVRVRLRSESDLFLTLTAQFCSLVPGSIIVEAHRLTGIMYVHVLDLEQSGGVAGVRKIVLDQERRILYALATQEELATAGLPRRQWWGGGNDSEAGKPDQAGLATGGNGAGA